MQNFREQHNAVSLEDKQNIIVEKLKDLNLKVTEAKSERLKLEADVATIKQGKAKTADELLLLPSVAALPVVAALRQELADRESTIQGGRPAQRTAAIVESDSDQRLQHGDQVL